MNIVSRFQMILDKLLGVVQLQEWPPRLLQPHPPKTKRRVYPWQTLFNSWRTTPPRYWVKHFSLFLFLDLFLLFLYFLVDFCLWFWSLFFFSLKRFQTPSQHFIWIELDSKLQIPECKYTRIRVYELSFLVFTVFPTEISIPEHDWFLLLPRNLFPTLQMMHCNTAKWKALYSPKIKERYG